MFNRLVRRMYFNNLSDKMSTMRVTKYFVTNNNSIICNTGFYLPIVKTTSSIISKRYLPNSMFDENIQLYIFCKFGRLDRIIIF